MAYEDILMLNGKKIRDVDGRTKIEQIQNELDNKLNISDLPKDLPLSQAKPEGARAWIQPTFPSYTNEFYYIDEWTQNVKFVKNSDNTAWITQENAGTSCNENKIYIGNVKQLKLTNNTSSDLSYFGYFKKLDGTLAYSGGSIPANGNTIIYCTLNSSYIYENVKLYIGSLINSGDITIEAIYE